MSIEVSMGISKALMITISISVDKTGGLQNIIDNKNGYIITKNFAHSDRFSGSLCNASVT
jgi:hypothetical protein